MRNGTEMQPVSRSGRQPGPGFSPDTGSLLSPARMREDIRTGRWQRPTPGCCPGYTQANVVILPAEYAFHFLLFCQRNPKPCPLLEVMEGGVFVPQRLAPTADIRTDCPRYRIFRKESQEERDHIVDLWRDDLVTFLLGCSFTFEGSLMSAGIPMRHIEEGKNVSMYVTDIPCESAGPFHGNLVVTMRPIPGPLVSRAVQVTSRYPAVHGAPIHIGDPAEIGISDLQLPDFGDPVTVKRGEIPVFWACGVTPQVAIRSAGLEFAVTHAPGCMFISDIPDEAFAIF